MDGCLRMLSRAPSCGTLLEAVSNLLEGIAPWRPWDDGLNVEAETWNSNLPKGRLARARLFTVPMLSVLILDVSQADPFAPPQTRHTTTMPCRFEIRYLFSLVYYGLYSSHEDVILGLSGRRHRTGLRFHNKTSV